MFNEKLLQVNKEKAEKLKTQIASGNLEALIYYNPTKKSSLTITHKYPKDGDFG